MDQGVGLPGRALGAATGDVPDFVLVGMRFVRVGMNKGS
jgi:hypothetical protein